MTEKQIKKAVELAEGFKWFENQNGLHIDFLEYSGTFLKDVNTWYLYPLLLYRAMDAINNPSEGIAILIDFDQVKINHKGVEKGFYFEDYFPTPYLTAQEQALEAALEEML